MTHSLSRRRFLQVVGGSSMIAAAPLIARNGALFSTRNRNVVRAAQPAGMIGRVVQVLKGDVKIHTYLAPEASFLVTSHIIETPNSLVIVDAQFLQTAAKDVLAYAESLGKPIDRVILSHAHPDHSSGGNIFADVPFVSTQAVAEGVQADIDGGGVEQRAGLVGAAEVPSEPRVPEGSVTAGEEMIDGVTFAYDIVNNAESPEQLNIRLPDYGVVVVQDLLYNNAHFFPGVDRNVWIKALQDLRGLTSYDTVLVGHGLPATLGIIDNAIAYLEFANEAAEGATSADEVIAALTAEYPTYSGTGILGFWGLFIQG